MSYVDGPGAAAPQEKLPRAAPGASQAAHHSQLGFLRRQTTGTELINQRKYEVVR